MIVNGNSMGGAAAVFAAGELGVASAGISWRALTATSGPPSGTESIRRLPPPLDLAAYAGLNLVAPVFLPHIDEISPLKAIAGIPEDVPVLFLAGGGDHLAPLGETRELH